MASWPFVSTWPAAKKSMAGGSKGSNLGPTCKLVAQHHLPVSLLLEAEFSRPGMRLAWLSQRLVVCSAPLQQACAWPCRSCHIQRSNTGGAAKGLSLKLKRLAQCVHRSLHNPLTRKLKALFVTGSGRCALPPWGLWLRTSCTARGLQSLAPIHARNEQCQAAGLYTTTPGGYLAGSGLCALHCAGAAETMLRRALHHHHPRSLLKT